MNEPQTACDYVFTGPANVAGRYMRMFWHPVYESAKLAKGQAMPLKVLGEQFTLYRDHSGKANVIGFRCPHRGTQMSTGWVEEDGIRCFFHGWKFAGDGACLEQPAEPKPFCHKVRIPSYPTEEQLGLIFVYLGTAPAPPLPRWPEFENEKQSATSIAQIPCNYFQSAENILDDVHVGFAHRATRELGGSVRGATPPRVSAKETSFGLDVEFSAPDNTEHNLFLMPNMCYVPYTLEHTLGARKDSYRMHTLFWYVPIDDTNHYHVQVSFGPPFITRFMREYARTTTHRVADDIDAVLSGNSNMHQQAPGPGSRTSDLIRVQDGVTIVGQGAIADRTRERLGASDAGVILLRKIWTRELRLLSGEKPLTTFARPAALPD
jgi:5,5'-dehydrodivanillate O-demethylase oxygenase subunit